MYMHKSLCSSTLTFSCPTTSTLQDEGRTLCVNCTITGAQDGVAVSVDIPQTLHQCLDSLRGRGRQQLEQHTPASGCPATLHYNIVRVNTHAHTFTCTVHISCCTALLQICGATYIDTKQTHTTEKQSYSYHMWWRDCNSREVGTNSLTSYIHVCKHVSCVGSLVTLSEVHMYHLLLDKLCYMYVHEYTCTCTYMVQY